MSNRITIIKYYRNKETLRPTELQDVANMISKGEYLKEKQANIIEAFLAFDGSDRTQLCEEIWNVASPKVDYYWRDGTFDALEELRTKELYNRKYGNGRSI